MIINTKAYNFSLPAVHCHSYGICRRRPPPSKSRSKRQTDFMAFLYKKKKQSTSNFRLFANLYFSLNWFSKIKIINKIRRVLMRKLLDDDYHNHQHNQMHNEIMARKKAKACRRDSRFHRATIIEIIAICHI